MRQLIQHWFLILFCISTLVVTGCTNTASTSASPAPTGTAATPERISSPISAAPTPLSIPKLEGKATVVMVVKGSPITLEVDGTNAPITAGNFVDLVQRGVYNGLSFHRVVREPEPFVVQGGSPASKNPNASLAEIGASGFVDPTTSQERYIPLEIKPEEAKAPVYSQPGVSQPVLKHTRGAVAMARSMSPNSASSQFYFALSDLPFLDGNYAVFGYVTDGMDVVDRIQQGDRIESAKVIKGLENLKN